MKTTTAYKVINQLPNGKLISCCLNPDFPDRLKVEYKLGEFVKPILKRSRLFVFTNLDEARNFAMDLRLWVYECEVSLPLIKYIPYSVSGIDWFHHVVHNKKFSWVKFMKEPHHDPYPEYSSARTTAQVKLIKLVNSYRNIVP